MIVPILLVVLILVAVLWMHDVTDCPRLLLGQDCRGMACDHSPKEMTRVKKQISKNQRAKRMLDVRIKEK